MTRYKIITDILTDIYDREEFLKKICEEIDKLGDSFVTVNIAETFTRCEAILFYKEESLDEEEERKKSLSRKNSYIYC